MRRPFKTEFGTWETREAFSSVSDLENGQELQRSHVAFYNSATFESPEESEAGEFIYFLDGEEMLWDELPLEIQYESEEPNFWGPALEDRQFKFQEQD